MDCGGQRRHHFLLVNFTRIRPRNKHRKGINGAEHYGKCIFHESKTNNTAFSFTADLAHCFSCNVKFRGAIDAVKEFRKCNFTEAVAFLEEREGKATGHEKRAC